MIKGKNTDAREDGHTEFCNRLPQMYDSSDASVHALHLLFPAKFRGYVQKKDKRGHKQGLTEWKSRTEDKVVSQTHRRPRLKLLRGKKRDHTNTATPSLAQRERLLSATVQSSVTVNVFLFSGSSLWGPLLYTPEHEIMAEWFQICLGGIIVFKGDRNDSFLVLTAGLVAISIVIFSLLSDFTEMIGFGGSKFYVTIKKRSGF